MGQEVGARLRARAWKPLLVICDSQLRDCELRLGAVSADLPRDPPPFPGHGIGRDLNVHSPDAIADLSDPTTPPSASCSSSSARRDLSTRQSRVRGLSYSCVGHRDNLRSGSHPAWRCAVANQPAARVPAEALWALVVERVSRAAGLGIDERPSEKGL
jgi:hypothetical protein